MLDIFAKYWAPISGLFSLATLILMALLGKTFAKKETVIQLQRDMENMKGQLDDTPTRTELHNLHLEIANFRGDLKELGPRLDRVQHMSDLLVETGLKEKA